MTLVLWLTASSTHTFCFNVIIRLRDVCIIVDFSDWKLITSLIIRDGQWERHWDDDWRWLDQFLKMTPTLEGIKHSSSQVKMQQWRIFVEQSCYCQLILVWKTRILEWNSVRRAPSNSCAESLDHFCVCSKGAKRKISCNQSVKSSISCFLDSKVEINGKRISLQELKNFRICSSLFDTTFFICSSKAK